MRYLILADIHANLTALETVLAAAHAGSSFEVIWCLGDIIGYGPDPAECIALLRTYEHLAVAGNHDLAAVAKLDTSDFNPDAARANQWTAQHLSSDDLTYIAGLPLTVLTRPFTLVHGSPREPVWEYVLGPREALDNFQAFNTPYCLLGHSHTPVVFEYSGPGHCTAHALDHGERVLLGERRLIVNPGGVGQPRDGDPRAAYAIYDSDNCTIYHYREKYDVPAVQKRMKKAGLPERLIRRLGEGW
jgi:predicted phosphodiesterase